MKNILIILLAITISAEAADDRRAGPNGGRVIESVDPHAEFSVLEDRRVQITFLDESLNPIAVADQTVEVIAGDRTNPTELSFTETNGTLTSDAPLPEGNAVPAVVRIKTDADSETVTERINVNLAQCPTCDYAEYACTCGH